MGFFENKRSSLQPGKEKWLSTFLIALGVAAAFFVPYIVMGYGYFIFYGDFNVQQIPFYQTCHAAVRSGNMSWSWTTDLGANFVGSYSFYLLGSPFFWLTIPFANWMIPYLMGPMLILKFGCAALSAYFYLRRFTKTPAAAQLGGILYAFSGFSIYNIFFNHFHEAIIFFPLLLLALELLMTENRRGFFGLMVAVCAISNYFFFFGMAVFVVIYFLVRVLSGAVKIKFSRFLIILLEAVLGFAMSAFLLLPSVLAVTGNSRVSEFLLGWGAIMYGREQMYLNIIQCFFFPPDLPARPVFFPGADVKWSSLGGWLPIFSMVGVFTLFSNKKGSWLKKIIGICTFMALVPILNSAFYAFNYAYYARWFYMPILMMCLATVMMAEDKSVEWKGGFKWVAGITLAIALTIGLFPQKDADGKLVLGLFTSSNVDDERFEYLIRYWSTVAIAVVGLVALGMLLTLLKKSRKTFFTAATVCVCIASVMYGNVYIASGRAIMSYDPKEVMIDQLIEGNVNLSDKGNFRVDVYDGVDNTSMYLGLPGMNAFHSVVPSSIMEFYDYIGYRRSVASRLETNLYAVRPLLSVKYLLQRTTSGKNFIDDNGEPLMPGFEYKKTTGGYYVYENKNYIPYGFSYDYYMSEEFCDAYAENSRQHLLLKGMLLTDKQIKKYGHMMSNLKRVRDNVDDEATTTLSFSEEAYAYDCAKLKETSADTFKIDNDGFIATISRKSDNLVFFSVPYDEGWRASVNGQAVEIERVNAGFMAVPVKKGDSAIRFTYTTPGLTRGLFITAGAAGLFLIYFLISYFYVKFRGAGAPYPEGDQLLQQWESDDIEMVQSELGLRLSQMDDGEPFSIFDEEIKIEIPKIENGFEGGFMIDPSVFDEE